MPRSRLPIVLALVLSGQLAAGMPAQAQTGRPMDLSPVTTLVSANGLAFPVADVGSGPVVLLLHGFPDDRHLWRYQARALVDAGYRVLAPDLRGFGDAPRPQDPKDYGIPLAVADVIGILDALQVPQVQLVAHDWGAAVGWRMAAEHPTRVTRYVALSVGAPGLRPSLVQRERSWYTLFFRQIGVAEQQLTANNWELFREWSRNAVDIDRWLANLSRPGALTAALNWYRATGGAPQTGVPPRVQCPVLGIWSDGDAYLTEEPMKTSGTRIAGPFQYVRVSGASHWMMVEKPDEISRQLLDFLQKR